MLTIGMAVIELRVERCGVFGISQVDYLSVGGMIMSMLIFTWSRYQSSQVSRTFNPIQGTLRMLVPMACRYESLFNEDFAALHEHQGDP